jgi:hypothetical protein
MAHAPYAVSRFLALDAREKRALLAAIVYLSRAWLVYRRQPAAMLVARLRQASTRSHKPAAAVPVDAERLAWALSAAARWLPFRADCLIQALAADLWLERRDVARDFHMAVSRTGTGTNGDAGGGIAAHAWLEVGGKAVSGGALAPDLVRFAGNGVGASGFSEKDP